MIETSGGYGQSLVRRYAAQTGKVKQQKRLPAHLFAEGIAQAGEHLWLLTWREGTALKLDANSFKFVDQHQYRGEGWGLTYDGEQLIMSNGTDRLTLRDADSFDELGSFRVYSPKTAGSSEERLFWSNLNELEFAQKLIWANVWQDSRILAIEPSSGAVKGILDLQPLVARNDHQPGHSVLNGIAYDAARDAFWVTGKLWPKRYLIQVSWPQGHPCRTRRNPPSADRSQVDPKQ